MVSHSFLGVFSASTELNLQTRLLASHLWAGHLRGARCRHQVRLACPGSNWASFDNKTSPETGEYLMIAPCFISIFSFWPLASLPEMRDSLGFMRMGGPDPLSCYLEIWPWYVGMSSLPREHCITPCRAEWGCYVHGWREWAAGCSHLLMAGGPGHGPCPQLLPPSSGVCYLLSLSCDTKRHRTRLICKGCKHFDLPPSWDGVCVPFLIPGLGKEDSGLPPGLRDKLLEPSYKKLDSNEIAMLRGDAEALALRCPLCQPFEGLTAHWALSDFLTHGLQVHRGYVWTGY